MFLFYHNEQNEKNISYYKGFLFESLLNDLLKSLGYSIELRRKHNSLEYDLEGTDKATDRKIIGEAKAFDKNIAGQVLSAFVGKLMPLGIFEKKLNGLFISTSPLTAEADEYYRSIKDYGIKCLTGQDLFNSIIENLKLPKIETLKESFITNEYELQSHFLLKTNIGLYIVLVTGTNDSVAPTYFTLFNSKGIVITDEKFLNELSENIPDFSSLKPFVTAQTQIKKEIIQRIIPSGLMVGSSWTDYRLPAGPSFYVGRDELISEIISTQILH